MMVFNGDIVRTPDGSYAWNPEKEKVKGIPGPLAVLEKAREELSEAFVKKGTNDHGIAYLVLYTVSRFAGRLPRGLRHRDHAGRHSRPEQSALSCRESVHPDHEADFSAGMDAAVALYGEGSQVDGGPCRVHGGRVANLATTAFGVSSLRKEYLHVAAIVQLSWFQRLFKVILPGAAPTIVNGLRISFGSALVAVVPAEMLLGELGVGYLSWIEWNNLDIAGVIFAILVVGVVGVILDAGFNKLAGLVTYQE